MNNNSLPDWVEWLILIGVAVTLAVLFTLTATGDIGTGPGQLLPSQQ